ncbi:MAG: hypothetical protein IJ047_00815 [Paludibacteraceae bacterium]|nr:hypothetical protein [Paludibacteraceae bacterium]
MSTSCLLLVSYSSLRFLRQLRYAAMVLFLTIGVGNAWGADPSWTHTFTSLPTITDNQFTVNSATWSISRTTGAGSPTTTAGNDNRVSCMKFGSEVSHYYSNITLSTNYFADYKVKSVYIVACTNNSNKTVPVTVTQGSGVSAVTIGTASFKVAYSSTWQNSSDCQKTIDTNEGNEGTLTISISPDACAFSIREITVTYSTAPACANAVTPAEGTKTNVSAMTFSSASVATCSSTASDRQVTVTITPSSCYSVPSSTRLSVTGTSASYVEGPTDNGDGTYSFVYQFAQNATETSTFAASLDTKTTYTVQYNAGSTTHTGGNAISGSHANDAKTCGTSLTLPGVVFTTTGYTQTGWTKTDGGSKTNNLSGSYSTEAAQTFYPVWTVNSYTVTWMVNNTTYSEGGSTSVDHGSRVSTLPTAPDPGDYCGDKFVGWTTDEEYVHGTSPLFTVAGSAPTATGAQTFYAVFADYDD